MHLHAWAVPREIDRDRWIAMRRDVLAVLQTVGARLERGRAPEAMPALRGPDGRGGIVVTDDGIAFNGNAMAGEAGDPCVLERAARRGYLTSDDERSPGTDDELEPRDARRNRAFRRCDTGGHPYDLAVCAVLLTALWHLAAEMRLGTQDTVRAPGWRAAADLVRAVLGVEAQLVQSEYGSIRWKTAGETGVRGAR